MNKQEVKLAQSYKVINPTAWTAMVINANPNTFADFNRLITAGVAATYLVRVNA